MASPEYQAITECRDLLVSTISQDPQGIADMMVKKFLISENLRDELGLQTLTKRAKARLVVDAMSDLVKQNSGHFDILVSIFISVGLWTGDLVTLLQKARRKCEHESQKETAIESSSGGSEFPALTLTVLTRELLTVTEPHLLGVGLGIEQHILETIVKNNKFDIEGQKMALFSYIANNHKRLNITWDDIASVLRDMLNKGNLALDIEKKIKSSRRDSLEDFPCFASPDTYDKMMEAALVPDPDQADQLPPAPNETDGRVGAVLHPPQNEETETLGASPEEHPSKNQHAKRPSKKRPSNPMVLTGADILTICENLKSASNNWFKLGLALGMKLFELENIKDQDQDNTHRLTMVVGKRLEVTDPDHPITWPYICECLRSPFVERKDVAEKIEALGLCDQ